MLSEWKPAPPRRNAYTTVMSWTSYKPLTYLRQSYGQKDLEFKRFLELLDKVKPVPIEVALGNVLGQTHLNYLSANYGGRC